MLGRQTMHRRQHRYWPFYRYAGCWWQHPVCQPPSLKWMGKPSDEEAKDVDENNMLEQIVRFARRLTS